MKFDQIPFDDDADDVKTWKGLAISAIMDLRRYAADETPHRRLVSADAYEEDAVRLECAGGRGAMNTDETVAWSALMATKESYRRLARELSEALIKVRPLGGSELFIQRDGQYYADPIYCGAAIESSNRSRHEAMVENMRLTRRVRELETQLAELARIRSIELCKLPPADGTKA